jgi:hypothetical protein
MSRNPLEEYRRIQRALRKDFDAFTTIHCASCPTPCCVRPARINPTDILLAQGIGWKAQVQRAAESDAVQRAIENATISLRRKVDTIAPTPCEHLGEKGCTFPADSRPFGCTTYVCPYMYRHLDRKTLSRIRRNVRELERRYHTLLEYLHRRVPHRNTEEAEAIEI